VVGVAVTWKAAVAVRVAGEPPVEHETVTVWTPTPVLSGTKLVAVHVPGSPG
jgi:hypothetical protein